MKFIDTHHDQWHTVGGEDGPMSHPPIKSHSLLTLGQWHAVREQWPAKGNEAHKPVGVILPNDTDVEVLEQDLAKLDLVVLQFPKWTDGRAYTQARILRVRYRFGGEVRATGLCASLPLAGHCSRTACHWPRVSRLCDLMGGCDIGPSSPPTVCH